MVVKTLKSCSRFFIALSICILVTTAVRADDSLDLEAYRGKYVYVDFWASWCTPCRASFPWMNELHRDFADKGLVIVAVNTGDTPADAEKFIKILEPEFLVIRDDKGKISETYELAGMPTSVLIDPNGDPISRHTGFNKKKAAEIRAEIENLMAQ